MLDLTSIERHLAELPKAPWYWQQSYEMATYHGDSEFHWALHNHESERNGRVMDLYTILLASYDKAMDGKLVSEQSVVAFVPWARGIIPELVAEVKRLRENGKRKARPVVKPDKDGSRTAQMRDLRKIGAVVCNLSELGKGAPDIAVGFRGRNWFFEIKDPHQKPSAQRLTPAEAVWHALWKTGGQVDVIRSAEDALRIMQG